MQWRRGFQTKFAAVAVALLAAGGALGVASARTNAPVEPEVPADAAQSGVMAQDPEVLSQEAKMYDDVGYAIWPGANQATGEGGTLGSSAVWIAHPTLPVPSYVELTRIDTGRTIVARVSARPALGRTGALIELSAGAARQLLLETVGQAALRVRAANPTDQEKAALRMGQAAGDRMDTPESLLVVLRKKAGTLAAVSTANRAAKEATPPPRAKPPVTAAATAPAGPRTSTGPHWTTRDDEPNAEPADVGSDGFVVEEAGARRPAQKAAPSKWQRPAAISAPAAPSSGFYVQVAALSSRWRAQQVAKQIGGGVQPAGNLFRVRNGPYPSEAAARAALGPLAAKGYRDARITR